MKNFILKAFVLLIVGAGTKALPQAIVPVNGVTPPLTSITVNNGVGDQYDPHISGEWAVYTSDLSIRYYNFATNTDAAIPMGTSARDLLSDVSGSKIVFSRVVTGVKTAVMVFDASTAATPIEIDPADGVTRIGSAIGGNTVAYIDFTLENHGELVIHDLVTSISTRITNDTAFDANPSVSPDGSVVTWEHCATSSSNCDIWQAVRTGAVWNVTTTSGTTDPEANPDNNGTLAVYDSFRSGNPDIYWRPVGGGTEAQLQMSGFEANPNITGNIICFESRPTLFDTTDIFVYNIVTNRLYQITNTPLVTEQLNDITVLPDGRVRVVWTTDEDGFDQRNVKAATFTLLPPVTNGKICYTNGGDIWKMDPDGSNRQLVIDAGTNDIEPEWSPDGSKIAFKSDRDIPPGRGIYSVNADGTGLTLLTNGGINNSDSNPTWSPDGSKIAFSSNRDGLIPSIYIMNADGSNVTRLTNQLPYSDQTPEWSPDGTRMIFETNQGLGANIAIINLNGTGRAVIGAGQFPTWSPDSTKIIFALLTETGYHIYTMNTDGSGITQLTFGVPNDQYPSFSPDGQKVVFARNTSGTLGLWTMNADGSNQVIFAGTNTIGNGYSDWGVLPVTPTATPTNTPTATSTNTPTATATPTPTSSPAISGTVTYANALGNPPPPRFVSNVLLSGVGSPNVSATTSFPGGTYLLSGFGSGSYTVTPTKTGGVNGAISSFDAAKIAQHVSGSVLLTGNALIAADTSNNGSVSSFDAAKIAQFVSGGTIVQPNVTGTWRFLPVNKNYASVTSNVTGEDYVALLMGEVSGNWANTAPPSPTPTPLTVLYDKLGGPGNWGWDGQGSYTSYFEDIDENDDFAVATFYIGSLSTAQTVKSIEFASSYMSIFTFENRDMSSLIGCKLKVWDMNIYSLYSNATIPSLISVNLGSINLGSTSVPVGSQSIPGGTRLVYDIGWDNLNVSLPANKPLELSLQCGVNGAFGLFGISGSSFAGEGMRSANKAPGGPQINQDLSQPLAAKIVVY